ncbi:MAG TPA: hypothetical protein VF444_02640 [Pseudonocardiaceae bacterium]
MDENQNAAGVVRRLTSGEPWAVEIRPGARVELLREVPDGPARVVFSDRYAWPLAGDVWLPISLMLPADVANQLFAQAARMARPSEPPAG